jgi:hypothetical protein
MRVRGDQGKAYMGKNLTAEEQTSLANFQHSLGEMEAAAAELVT